MKKTPTIFIRNYLNMKEILPEHNPECSWVFSGEGVATRKYDGTCCLVCDGKLWKRREVKKDKGLPGRFKLVSYDEITGKTVGWVPVDENDKWHLEAFNDVNLANGTYELCGPKVQGNPENFDLHILVPHSEATQYDNVTRTFEGVKSFLEDMDIEGLVFHHKDGRMAKIKKRDYQLER